MTVAAALIAGVVVVILHDKVTPSAAGEPAQMPATGVYPDGNAPPTSKPAAVVQFWTATALPLPAFLAP